MSTIKPTYETNDGLRPIKQTPSIREILDGCHELSRRIHSKEELEAEDLNDSKCAWLVAATSVPERCLTDKERGFVDRYRNEGLSFSMHWNRKPEIVGFYMQKKQEYKNRIQQWQDLRK